jgi:hypothetical protein
MLGQCFVQFRADYETCFLHEQCLYCSASRQVKPSRPTECALQRPVDKYATLERIFASTKQIASQSPVQVPQVSRSNLAKTPAQRDQELRLFQPISSIWSSLLLAGPPCSSHVKLSAKHTNELFRGHSAIDSQNQILRPRALLFCFSLSPLRSRPWRLMP